MSPNEAMADHVQFTEMYLVKNEEEIKVEDSKAPKSDTIAAEDYAATINKPFFQRKDIKWMNLYFIAALHVVALYGFLTFPYREKKLTFVWGWFLAVVANFGVAGGIHRLWAHRAYKAKLPLRIILLLCYLTSGQYSAVYWIRDHRVHHKYTETDADPVNALRGFWFSHCGWLTMKRHPEVLRKGKQIYMKDVLDDPVIQFGEKYFEILRLVIAFIIPICVPVYFWGETWYWAIMSQMFMRYAYSLNCTWGVNSFAHMFGNHPYDKNIEPAENIMMSLMTGGEGWHNYHHVFPWDYKTSELGNYITNINLTALLIDMFATIGWAYDLKQPSKELIKTVIKNRGDGTHPVHGGKKAEEKSQ